MLPAVNSTVLERCRFLNQQGINLAQQARLEEAAASFQEILRHDAGFVDAYCNLGLVYSFQRRYDEAVRWIEKAVALQPGHPVILNNFSNALREQGELHRAVEAARRALSVWPQYAEAHNNLGAALVGLRKFNEAQTCLLSAVQFNPASAEAHSNLGDVYRRLNFPVEAVQHGREALRLRPDCAEWCYRLAESLMCCNDHREAESWLLRALQLNPDLWEASLGLAQLDMRWGKLAEAEVRCRNLVALLPEKAEIHNGLGVILKKQGRLAEAREQFERALRLKPDFADAHFYLGMLLLLQGDFIGGLPEYEWRWQSHSLRQLPEPAWDGSSLEGRTLVLHPEQGTGDTLQFIRYGPLLQRSGARVLLACDGNLPPLLSRSGVVDGFLHPGETPPGAVHASLMSLPMLLKTTAETIPAPVPYLKADPDRVELWRTQLAGLPGRKVGVCWQGNRYHLDDHLRSFPPARLEPLARVPGTNLISLQVGYGSEQILSVADRFELLDANPRLDHNRGAFVDLAALMLNLDLVVTCDTAVAHLAGALAVPTWVALPFAPDWRWQLDRIDSPWYPSMRLFRQQRPADWDGVFLQMAQELERMSRH
ncbi:MAG TPA: tetratricopeptide repeat protein [Gemmata sp.]|jgi:tetratricopeptide (TPR) repeat protein|nr:tetratricopeptide repeat protein [Gemmata sp.]